jgi:hypothetical protein
MNAPSCSAYRAAYPMLKLMRIDFKEVLLNFEGRYPNSKKPDQDQQRFSPALL